MTETYTDSNAFQEQYWGSGDNPLAGRKIKRHEHPEVCDACGAYIFYARSGRNCVAYEAYVGDSSMFDEHKCVAKG